jgi:hypothetical protein
MAPTRKKPTSIQIPGGERYKATVLRVIELDGDGSPRKFEILREDETIKPEEGMQFWVVYAPEKMTRRRN